MVPIRVFEEFEGTDDGFVIPFSEPNNSDEICKLVFVVDDLCLDFFHILSQPVALDSSNIVYVEREVGLLEMLGFGDAYNQISQRCTYAAVNGKPKQTPANADMVLVQSMILYLGHTHECDFVLRCKNGYELWVWAPDEKMFAILEEKLDLPSSFLRRRVEGEMLIEVKPQSDFDRTNETVGSLFKRAHVLYQCGDGGFLAWTSLDGYQMQRVLKEEEVLNWVQQYLDGIL